MNWMFDAWEIRLELGWWQITNDSVSVAVVVSRTQAVQVVAPARARQHLDAGRN
jgi:hypothetical protein